MLNFLALRLLVMIPTLIAISILVFILIQLPPGDYLTAQLMELQAQGDGTAAEQIAFLRAEYGLDRPIYIQYWDWATGLLVGDLGQSFEFNKPVSDVLGDRLLMTFILNFSTILFIWVVSFPIAIYSATHQYSVGDYGLTFIGFIGLATPNFLLALVLLYLANAWFGTSIGGLMAPEYLDQPWSIEKALSVLAHLWVPVVVIGTSGTAAMIRRLRANLL
ncbi:MAG: ABC transporter permease, partial [Pseudomonadota bacterium]